MNMVQVLLGCHDPGLYDRLYPAGWSLLEDMAPAASAVRTRGTLPSPMMYVNGKGNKV